MLNTNLIALCQQYIFIFMRNCVLLNFSNRLYNKYKIKFIKINHFQPSSMKIIKQSNYIQDLVLRYYCELNFINFMSK